MPCIRSLRGRSKDRVCLEGGFTPKPMQGDLKLQLKRANAAFTKRNSASPGKITVRRTGSKRSQAPPSLLQALVPSLRILRELRAC